MAEMSMVEKVARGIGRYLSDGPRAWEEYGSGFREICMDAARAAIEAMPLEQLIADAYVRGVEWNEENPLDREYRFKASLDYADKTLFVALNEEVTG